MSAIRGYAHDHGAPLIDFAKGERKDDLLHKYLARSDGSEQVLFIGRAQEKARVFRTELRRNPTTGAAYPWVVTATAMVNQFYVYAIDEDFGPFFIKFSSYFPFTGRLCINGHEYIAGDIWLSSRLCAVRLVVLVLRGDEVGMDPGYPQTTNVINGFSDLILELYGSEAGEHARMAVGMAALPLNPCVTVAADRLSEAGVALRL